MKLSNIAALAIFSLASLLNITSALASGGGNSHVLATISRHDVGDGGGTSHVLATASRHDLGKGGAVTKVAATLSRHDLGKGGSTTHSVFATVSRHAVDVNQKRQNAISLDLNRGF